MRDASPQPARYGFITIVDVPELGHAGGLLVLSPEGRPIEFHCTPPIAENKTQKILYGQTYQGFLFCDQIAAALVEKSKSKPELLITDRPELMPLSKRGSVPVVKLCQEIEAESAKVDAANAVDSTSDHSAKDNQFDVNGETLSTDTEDLERAAWAKVACQHFAEALPLIEPFERIRLAIGEAGSASR